ncbi:MAG: hypothetical protein IT210_00075 [Armatimonadetes bacterium]|nr:hypothetical protein [Armatimonadota bacterium]
MAFDPQSGRREMALRIFCVRPPQPQKAGAEFGLQAKDHRLTAGSLQPDGSLLFETRAQVRPHPENGLVDFAGPFIHGRLGQRFLYLSLRSDPALPGVYERRMKVPLPSIAWEPLHRASQEGCSLSGAVQGTGKDGGLNCGSVRLLGGGWSVEG